MRISHQLGFFANVTFKKIRKCNIIILMGSISSNFIKYLIVGSMVEWLKRRARDQHGLGSKPTCAILLCPWERYFTALSPAWWSWQAVLNYSYISIKLQINSNILASPEAGRGNCLLC